MSHFTWDNVFVPNGLGQFNQDSGSCSGVGLQHFNMNGVYAWGCYTLHSFDGVLDFSLYWGSGVDIEVIWRW